MMNDTPRPPPPRAMREDVALLSRDDDDSNNTAATVSSRRPRCRWRWCTRRNLCTTVNMAILTTITIVTITTLLYDRHHTPPPSAIDTYMSTIKPSSILEYLHYFTDQSHIAGSARGYDTAVFVRDRWRAVGIPRVEIEEFSVLLSYPVHRSVKLLAPIAFTCTLKEDVVKVDPTSGKPSPATFLGYSASGNVTAPVIYVNYGRQSDFAALVTAGVQLSGRIAIVRYGEVFRGDKVVLAEEHGMVGVLIYSDPADDGYGRGAVYPDGPWRPPSGVQRGTVFTGHGDPLTPGGVPSVPNAPRLRVDDVYRSNATDFPLPTIPAMCLGYADAEPILRALEGSAPLPSAEWQGGIRQLNYSVGPGASSVELVVEMNATRTTIYNVIGDVPGVQDDRYVLIGNHRDAWTFGGGDPSSGTAVLMEIAEGLGALMTTRGWQPERTIRLCSWDAEEYALIGSTEHVEKRSVAYTHEALVYLNTDVALAGSPALSIGGMPVLTDIVRDVARTIPAPSSAAPHTNLLELWSLSQPLVSGTDGLPVLEASDLGEGSDYGAFIQYIGVPSVDFSFGSSSDGYEGVYHSNYDSYYWITHFADPTGEYGACLAQMIGVVALRLSTDPTVPFGFRHLPMVLQRAAAGVHAIAPPDKLDVQPLFDAITGLTAVIASSSAASGTSSSSSSTLTDIQRRVYDDRMLVASRGGVFLPGVRGRPWYRNMIWTTAMYDGYSSSAFSLITDQFVIENYENAQYYVQLISVVIDQMASLIRRIQ